jgi:oligoendopeptidase F
MNKHAKFSGWIFIVIVGAFVLPTVAVLAGDERRVPERSEIDTKYLWATETIFPSKAEWEEELATVEKLIEKMARYEGTLANGPNSLLKAVKARDETEPRLVRVYVYASLLSDQDTREGDPQAMKARAGSLATKYEQATSWLEPELTAIPFETLDSWLREKPQLDMYRQAFDDLFRQKKYILSPREEELLAMAWEVRSTPSNAYNFLSNADMKFPTIKDEEGKTRELDDSSFHLFMRSSNRRVRKDAYEAIVGTYAEYRNTAAALLNGAVQSHVLTVKARGYDNCLSASLHGPNIPPEVYNNLVRAVNDNLDSLHRYQDLRRRALRLEDGVHAYDLIAPFIAGQQVEYTYEEAAETILTALEPLGAEYLTLMKKGFSSRWVDVYPTKGKRRGAFSKGTYLTQPYILLNFRGGYEDTATLAHEMGHSMHCYLSCTAQPYVYADRATFCAEVASTCNEILLQGHVLKQIKDPRKRLYLLGELEGIRRKLFRQTMFSEFEQRIHEMAEAGVPLTADSMGAAYGKIMRKYYGSSYAHDELVDNYWIRIPHFYYNFYVYKYATSYCAASNIANRITAGEPGAREAYMKFLRGGSSKYPIDLLKMARVDMTKPEPIEDAMKLFESLLDQTEALLVELGML